MDIRTEVKYSTSGMEIHLSGKDVAKLQSTRLSAFLRSRVSCMVRNGCKAGDARATKLKCVSALIKHKFEERAVPGSDSTVIRIKGDAAKLRRFATQERLGRIVNNFVACRTKNRCSPEQELVGRWNCVNTLAQHILQR
jgi:hypothetical protein